MSNMPSRDEIETMAMDLIDSIADGLVAPAVMMAEDNSVDGNDLWKMVMDECERVTASWELAAIVVIHYNGIHDALVGEVDKYGDYPIRWLENAVLNAVEIELGKRGIEVI